MFAIKKKITLNSSPNPLTRLDQEIGGGADFKNALYSKLIQFILFQLHCYE